MGLPTITFELAKAADQVAGRSAAGHVALILKDAAANGLHRIHRAEDIPDGLSAANIGAIRRCLLGGERRPALVAVAIIPVSGSVADGFAALSAVSYDYLAGPPDISSEDAQALSKLVLAARALRYTGKVVLPGVASDDEGVINFVAEGIQADGETYTAAQYCSRIAGLLAGTPASASATYAPLPEVTAITATENPDAAVDAGKLILLNDGRQVKLGRAVTSKTTIGPGESQALKKIKLVAALDLIRFYGVSVVEDRYLGKFANTYDNKCLLLVDLRAFLRSLELQDILKEGSTSAELNDAATRAFLIQQAEDRGNHAEVERIKALPNAQLVREPTGSHVFIRLAGYALDAMEDFALVLDLGA